MLQLPLQPPSTKQLPLSEWRAFGAYSRPTVNGVDVHNTFTPSPTPYRELDPDEVDVEEVFRSLRSPSGATHPERWVRGIKHPALPQNPNWHVPGPNEPLPFPWECQLNPFLQASVTGPAPVYWNILKSRGMVLFGGPLDVSIPLAPQDLAQPATFPLVTHMYISGLGLAAARFPWKFCVVNAAGVRVRDVFDAILINFFELVFPAEVAQWAPERLARAKLEFQLRGGDVATDGLRRMDCLGGQLYFRGLAPNPDRTGWLLFVGPEW
ncbi:hypothetical protein GGX14DRAFT_383227 [Mycena pura]|uniref:DUF6699 domain-containing protein n=1 Tax=Mycena pura TaxID=153505 RepID=A0AAD6UKV3_9AGAR|nr:hypothetical protein GGX14DRAFT_383227 [Mycena pura]